MLQSTVFRHTPISGIGGGKLEIYETTETLTFHTEMPLPRIEPRSPYRPKNYIHVYGQKLELIKALKLLNSGLTIG